MAGRAVPNRRATPSVRAVGHGVGGLCQGGGHGPADQLRDPRRARPRRHARLLPRRPRLDGGVDVPGEVLMIQAGEHLVLSLWARPTSRPRSARSGAARASCRSRSPTTWRPATEVDAVLATARAAGADPVHEAVEREWGGYTGYFGDPDGYRWEIAAQPRTDRTGGAAMSDEPTQTVLSYPQVRGRGARRLAAAVRRAARPVRDRRLRHRARAGRRGSAPRPRRPTTTPTST